MRFVALAVLASLSFSAPSLARVATSSPHCVAVGPVLVVTIANGGAIYVGATATHNDMELVKALEAAVAHGHDEVRILADKSTPYREVIRVMDLCTKAGLTKISLG